MNIVGREKEINLLEQIVASREAEFVAVYGRRRVGKTFLIQQVLSTKDIYLECTGIKDGSLQEQLLNFSNSFIKIFYPRISLQPPANWREAFELLTNEVKKNSSKKVIVFFDELPWLASPKSQLLQYIDYFWNTEWSKLPNFKFVVCGSAASWMLNNLINAKGGLHNRLTHRVLLKPFDLTETKLFLERNKIKVTQRQVLDIYMIMGGIPFYLKQIKRSKSFAQIVNDLCFKEDGALYDEFPRLFKSLFEDSTLNLQIVKEIAKKHYGISFAELVEKVGKKPGGRFKERLEELESAGFIRSFLPYGKKARDHYYRVIDPYTLFYLRWISAITDAHAIPKNADYWTKMSGSQAWFSWAGYAFEVVCLTHADKIIKALKLEKIGCLISHWQYKPKTKDESGAQIDLLLDRDDDAITICEVKYSKDKFILDKAYAKELSNKMEVFEKHLKKPKQVFLALVTTEGLKNNIWSEDLIDGVVELSDFFKN